MSQTFDLTEALEQIKAGAKIDGKNGVLVPLIKQLTEAVLQAELESHLTTEMNKNRKNGKSSKTMKSSVGEFELVVPRDRNGSYEPQIVKKNQTHMSEHIEQKILSLYPFVWLNAIHYKIKDNERYIFKAVYTILGVGLNGKKEILGLYLSEDERANFWLQVLTDLNNKGVEDILIASIDGLKGFPEAINAIFPNTEIQLCIVHQIRNSKWTCSI